MSKRQQNEEVNSKAEMENFANFLVLPTRRWECYFPTPKIKKKVFRSTLRILSGQAQFHSVKKVSLGFLIFKLTLIFYICNL